MTTISFKQVDFGQDTLVDTIKSIAVEAGNSVVSFTEGNMVLIRGVDVTGLGLQEGTIVSITKASHPADTYVLTANTAEDPEAVVTEDTEAVTEPAHTKPRGKSSPMPGFTISN